MKSHNRHIYLINPRFQIKFSIFMSVIILLSNLVYPFVVYNYVDYFIVLLDKLLPSHSLDFAAERKNVITLLIVFQILFALLISFICVFFSHKVAGPLHKLKLFLESMRENKSFSQSLYFRDTDYFTEVADEVNKTLDVFREAAKEKLSVLNEIGEQINHLGHSVSENNKDSFNRIKEKLTKMKNDLEAAAMPPSSEPANSEPPNSDMQSKEA